MKSLITFSFLSLLNPIFAQTHYIMDLTTQGDCLVGIQHKPKKTKVGFYFTAGGNQLLQMLGGNYTSKMVTDRDFSSSVDWYTDYGCVFPVMPNTQLWTGEDFGNQFLESGIIINSVKHTTDSYYTNVTAVNLGIVIPHDKIQLRIGGGFFSQKVTGSRTISTLNQKIQVNKYRDLYNVVPGGIHVTERDLNTTSNERVQDISSSSLVPNIQVSVNLPVLDHWFSLGFDLDRGITFGMIINFNSQYKNVNPNYRPYYPYYYPRTYVPRYR
jgi:hypothetical protein